MKIINFKTTPRGVEHEESVITERNECTMVYIRLMLPAWFLGSDKRYFYLLTAFGAGYIKGNRLLHDAFGDDGNYRVDVVKAIVQHIQPFFKLLDAWCRFFA